MFCARIFAVALLFLMAHRVLAQPADALPPQLKIGRYGMPAVAVGNAIYVLGGVGIIGPFAVLSNIERIDRVGESLVVSAREAPILPRVFHSAEADGPFIYLFGGVTLLKTEAVPTQRVERLDTRDWKVEIMAPMPRGLRSCASVIQNGVIYVAGGSDENGDRTNELLIYDIATNSWTQGAPMLERKECELLPFQNGLLAVGGFDGEFAVRGVQFYDIRLNQWRELPLLPVKTSAHHGVASENLVILFGDYAELGRVQSGNPLTGEWQMHPNTPFTPRRHHATILVGENIYVIGGNIASSRSFLTEIEVFSLRNFRP